MNQPAALASRSRWQRWIWLVCGAIFLAIGVIGIVLPVLPTTPFVLLAAYCISRGSARYEQWLLRHHRFGPMVRDWRANRAVPLRAKQFASVMMILSSVLAWWMLPANVRWIPAVCCAAVAAWLWSLPMPRWRGAPPVDD
ncbi:MAG: DUF454 domain-containing protein [Rhodoferax sp.]|uniref:YbaN family protein n=1 Tax=Rhodoferax sp. TaxID=50421 RepID=UPI001400F042|nr:YbaN family protein [Rhodoferax sp.]NDP39029.1 DUF454 domain-containing protein [Rhodoferax sp.]